MINKLDVVLLGVMSLQEDIVEFLKERGVVSYGFATTETLEGGPPSTDLTYLLPSAKSAITFTFPLDRDAIKLFISKKSYREHVIDNIEVNKKAVKTSIELAEFLRERGYEADIPPAPGKYIGWSQDKESKAEEIPEDAQYRQEVKNWRLILPPVLSQRYIAVRSGVACYGWSGNLGIKGYGANIILGTTVTSAPLEPTPPLGPEDNFCDDCKLCVSACASRMMERDDATTVTLGGVKFSYAARKSILRCQMTCGGFSGLDPSGKWSTWSPGRFDVPKEKVEPVEMARLLGKAFVSSKLRPPITNPDHDVPIRLTCAFCQLICFGNRKETAENFRMIVNSGVVIQKEDGELVVLPPDEGKALFETFDQKHRRHYENRKRKAEKTAT